MNHSSSLRQPSMPNNQLGNGKATPTEFAKRILDKRLQNTSTNGTDFGDERKKNKHLHSKFMSLFTIDASSNLDAHRRSVQSAKNKKKMKKEQTY